MAVLVRAHDWSATALGPTSSWPQSLETALGICLESISPVGICWGRELIALYNDAWQTLLGNRHPAALGSRAGEVFPEIWSALEPRVATTLASGQATEARNQRLRLERDGYAEDRWFDFTFNPIPDGAGGTGGVFVIAFEITDHVRAASELRISEQRFRTLAEATTNALYRVDATGTYLVEVYGGVIPPHPREAAPSSSWLVDYVHPDDREETLVGWQHALATGTPYRRELRARRADGSWGWVLSHAVPVRDEAGVVVEWIGSATDINERKRTEEALAADVCGLQQLRDQQRVLVGELQHRTRNLLAVVRAIASQTFAHRGDDDTLESFLERLSSLGRVQGLLSRAEGERVKLFDIVHAELQAHGDGYGSRLEIHGSDVRLSSHQVQTIALALHELLTNALKYGALKAPAGRLSVTWETWLAASGRPRLALMWRESGVAMPPAAPARRGHGRELIEEALRFSLRAETQLVFGSDGVWCRIELPLDVTSHSVLDTSRVQPHP